MLCSAWRTNCCLLTKKLNCIELIVAQFAVDRTEIQKETMPPPPPPPGPPRPPPAPSGGGGSPRKIGGGGGGGAPDRGALLQSIQQGKKLKKTVTNDRSAPQVGGKARSPTSPQNSHHDVNDSNGRGGPPRAQNGGGNSNSSGSRLPGIGGLFVDGIPKLKKTQGGVHTGRPQGT